MKLFAAIVLATVSAFGLAACKQQPAATTDAAPSEAQKPFAATDAAGVTPADSANAAPLAEPVDARPGVPTSGAPNDAAAETK